MRALPYSQIRAGVVDTIPKAVVMVPVLLTHMWFVHEMIVSVKWVRRTMIEEERKRRIALRRISSRQRRNSRSPPPALPSPLVTTVISSDTVDEDSPTAPILWKTRSLVTAKKAVSATMAAGTASVAATSESAGSVIGSPTMGSPHSVSGAGPENGGSSGSDRERKGEHQLDIHDGEYDKRLGIVEGGSKEGEGVYSPPPPVFSETKKLPAGFLPGTHEQGHDWREPDGMVAVSARAVRISYLLQAWVRLWLAMSGFAIVAGVLMLLLFVRFLGVSAKDLPSSVIASPAIFALSALAVHSLIILDGTGGTTGSAALRGGGRCSSLALGRRPIIVLSLICATIISAKLDAEDVINVGGTPPYFLATCNRLSYAAAFTPLWLAAFLVEGVYLRALWESRTGQSCVSFVLRSGKEGDWGWMSPCRRLCSCCLRLGDCDSNAVVGGGGGGYGRGRRSTDRDGRRRPPSRRIGQQRRTSFHQTERRVSFYSAARRRAVLTPSQRAAAAAISGGILFIVIAMVGCSLRRGMTETASWAVPMTMLMAAAGEGLLGAGLWRLAQEHCHALRGGVPEPAKPLPVLYSEREGGWIVGPGEPPTVSIFLLGEVLLRQEGFGTGFVPGAGDAFHRWAPYV